MALGSDPHHQHHHQKPNSVKQAQTRVDRNSNPQHNGLVGQQLQNATQSREAAQRENIANTVRKVATNLRDRIRSSRQKEQHEQREEHQHKREEQLRLQQTITQQRLSFIRSTQALLSRMLRRTPSADPAEEQASLVRGQTEKTQPGDEQQRQGKVVSLEDARQAKLQSRDQARIKRAPPLEGRDRASLKKALQQNEINTLDALFRHMQNRAGIDPNEEEERRLIQSLATNPSPLAQRTVLSRWRAWVIQKAFVNLPVWGGSLRKMIIGANAVRNKESEQPGEDIALIKLLPPTLKKIVLQMGWAKGRWDFPTTPQP